MDLSLHAAPGASPSGSGAAPRAAAAAAPLADDDGSSGGAFAFVVTNAERTLALQAPSAAERERWLLAIYATCPRPAAPSSGRRPQAVWS